MLWKVYFENSKVVGEYSTVLCKEWALEIAEVIDMEKFEFAWFADIFGLNLEFGPILLIDVLKFSGLSIHHK